VIVCSPQVEIGKNATISGLVPNRSYVFALKVLDENSQGVQILNANERVFFV
jgi:hypothetical protein